LDFGLWIEESGGLRGHGVGTRPAAFSITEERLAAIRADSSIQSPKSKIQNGPAEILLARDAPE
jgi:hypothetical protein